MIVPAVCLLLLVTCEQADELVPTPGNNITGISIIQPNGVKTDYAPEIDAENTIRIEVEGSINTDMTKLRMSVNVPNNATVVSDPQMGTYMDFSKPVTFDVIGADGEKKTYTVIANLVATAIQVEELWRRTGSEIGFTQHNNRSVAISGDYLVVHDRATRGAYQYYDLLTGEGAGVLSNEGTDMDPLHMISDDAGNIVSCSFTPGAGSELRVYWWKGVTAQPELLLKWTSDAPGNIGRKLYAKGDFSTLGYLYATVSDNDLFLRWEVKDGKVTSEIPEKIEFTHPNGGWGANGRVIPAETGKNSNYYINSNGKVRITYMNGTDHTPIYNSEDHIQDVFHQWLGGGHAFDYVDMNGARYIFLIEQNGDNWMREIFTVRKMMQDPASIENITKLIHTRTWNDWLDFPLDPALGSNGNVTGEVKAQVAADGNSAIVAFICTNGGVMVWKIFLA